MRNTTESANLQSARLLTTTPCILLQSGGELAAIGARPAVERAGIDGTASRRAREAGGAVERRDPVGGHLEQAAALHVALLR
eukprot:1155562-Pyramimonas_sp.AAC.1